MQQQSMSEFGVQVQQSYLRSGIDARLEDSAAPVGDSVIPGNAHAWGSFHQPPSRWPDTVAFYDMNGTPLGKLRLGGSAPQIIIDNAGFEPHAMLLKGACCRKYGAADVIRPYLAHRAVSTSR